MYEWCSMCGCMCMRVFCMKCGCMFCVPAWAFSTIFIQNWKTVFINFLAIFTDDMFWDCPSYFLYDFFCSLTCFVHCTKWKISLHPFMSLSLIFSQVKLSRSLFVMLKQVWWIDVCLHLWRNLRKRTLLRNKYHRPWSDAAHVARRLIRACDICR